MKEEHPTTSATKAVLALRGPLILEALKAVAEQAPLLVGEVAAASIPVLGKVITGFRIGNLEGALGGLHQRMTTLESSGLLRDSEFLESEDAESLFLSWTDRILNESRRAKREQLTEVFARSMFFPLSVNPAQRSVLELVDRCDVIQLALLREMAIHIVTPKLTLPVSYPTGSRPPDLPAKMEEPRLWELTSPPMKEERGLQNDDPAWARQKEDGKVRFSFCSLLDVYDQFPEMTVDEYEVHVRHLCAVGATEEGSRYGYFPRRSYGRSEYALKKYPFEVEYPPTVVRPSPLGLLALRYLGQDLESIALAGLARVAVLQERQRTG